MTRAIELRQETVMLVSTQTNQPTADLQAMLENWQEFDSNPNNPLMIVLDFKADDGRQMDWAEMPKTVFDEYFRFVWTSNPNKFEPAVRL